MVSSKRTLYYLSGPALVGVLVGTVFVLRTLLPSVPSAAVHSPRAKGPVNAPIQIIEYSDFQCPACKAIQSTVKSLLSESPGQIRLLFNHFPLEGHPWSPLAHRAAECAALQNRFWEYHDKLYAEQETWSKSLEAPVVALLTYAKDVGMHDLDEFGRCLADSKMDRGIIAEREVGMSLGVRSTPSFFVNGKLAVGVDGLTRSVKQAQSVKR